jgi:hypothetical protein
MVVMPVPTAEVPGAPIAGVSVTTAVGPVVVRVDIGRRGIVGAGLGVDGRRLVVMVAHDDALALDDPGRRTLDYHVALTVHRTIEVGRQRGRGDDKERDRE